MVVFPGGPPRPQGGCGRPREGVGGTCLSSARHGSRLRAITLIPRRNGVGPISGNGNLCARGGDRFVLGGRTPAQYRPARRVKDDRAAGGPASGQPPDPLDPRVEPNRSRTALL